MKYKLPTLTPTNPSKKILTDFYVFDVETGRKKKDETIRYHLRGTQDAFIFGVIYGHNFTKVIYSVSEFQKEFLLPRYKGKKVFAHNAEYDLSTIYGNIYQFDSKAIFNNKFICATNGNCTFADSLNIYKASVKKIGAMLGMNKGELKAIEKTDSKAKKKGITSAAINYCIRDCEIVYEALVRIFEDCGTIKITQAGLSMAYFRNYHLNYPIEHNHLKKHFWDSYFGGRTEAFKIGKTNSSVIDVNSMYPYIMRNIDFPNPKLLKTENRVSVKRFEKILKHYEGCIYCTVTHEKSWLGYLPVKQDGKLIFPIGTFSGCWNFNEIRFALEKGVVQIKNIERVVYAERFKSPFVSFVDDLYLKRFKTENELEVFRIKILMNSLYGKFGSRVIETTEYINDLINEFDYINQKDKEGKLIRLSKFNSERLDAFMICKVDKPIDHAFSIPSFASYITSGARVLLLKKLLDLEKCKPVYCDTDSIFFEIDKGEYSETNKKLGEWKLEKKIVTEIRGLKNYSYLEKGIKYDKIKGVQSDAIKLSDEKFMYYSLVKTKEALHRQIEPMTQVKRIKIIKSKYDKRILLNDGSTKPIEIIC
jgi:hypothetical protein